MIRHATAADAEFCAGILTAAFADDPVSRWLVADPDPGPVAVTEQYAERFALFERTMHARHPDGPVHDYLMLLGAWPDQQSRGLGSALLAHRLANLDPVGKPTYLVATTRRSATGVYARAGYRPLGEPIQFPEGLQVYPLWRDPPPTPEAVNASRDYRRWRHRRHGHRACAHGVGGSPSWRASC